MQPAFSEPESRGTLYPSFGWQCSECLARLTESHKANPALFGVVCETGLHLFPQSDRGVGVREFGRLRSWSELLTSDSYNQFDRVLEVLFSSGGEFRGEFEFKCNGEVASDPSRTGFCLRGVRSPSGHRLVEVFRTKSDSSPSPDPEISKANRVLRGAMEGSFDAVLILDAVRGANGEVVDFLVSELNDKASEMLHLPKSDLIGHRVKERLPFLARLPTYGHLVAAVEDQQAKVVEFEAPGRRRRLRWFREQIIPTGDALSVTISDISERKITELTLEQSRELVKRVTTAVPEFLYIWDLEKRRTTYRNRSILAELGHVPHQEAFLTLDWLRELLHPLDQEKTIRFFNAFERVDSDEPKELEFRLRKPNGEYDWFFARHTVFKRDESGIPVEVFGTAQSIMERKNYEERLHDQMRALRAARVELENRQVELELMNERLATLAARDGLTGLFNYRVFRDQLEAEVARSRRSNHPLALVMIDVDDFKFFNDRFGHQAGDDRLKRFAAILLEVSRQCDVVARYGGEEFVVILPETTLSGAGSFAERVCRVLNEQMDSVPFTASFGCAELSIQGDASILLEQADRALYQAKNNGKNRVVLFQQDGRAAG